MSNLKLPRITRVHFFTFFHLLPEKETSTYLTILIFLEVVKSNEVCLNFETAPAVSVTPYISCFLVPPYLTFLEE